jgi:predicted nucleotidyltransferase
MNLNEAPPSDVAAHCLSLGCEIFKSSLLGKFSDRLVSMVQFGSTARGQIKHVTDLDLFVILDVPFASLRDKREATAFAEDAADGVLCALRPLGYFISVSCVVRSKAQALQFTPLYLDMTLHSKIHFDSEDFAKNILDRTRKQIKESGAVRKQRGLLWYWDLAPNFKHGDKPPF